VPTHRSDGSCCPRTILHLKGPRSGLPANLRRLVSPIVAVHTFGRRNQPYAYTLELPGGNYMRVPALYFVPADPAP
jgi:hypothetical protein